MNYEETLATLKAIQASYSPTPFLMDPDAEPRFVINSNERTITIPEEFKFLAVKMDHMSERIYFEIPRYFDGEDLSTKICVVQYINANGKEAVEGIAAIVDVDYTSEADKIIFRWNVDNNTTKYAGDVSFSVRFYTISDDNQFTYSWNTVPAILPILDTIDNTGQTVTENYPTELLQWQYRMTELDRTISEKIEEATASIDADTKAAQAARKGAEDAESRVQAIVAGNESYTKQQSHDLFALALKGTAEAAKSITIYPDKGSNVVATVNGFTKQAGTGDPSLTNVRAITNGGRFFNATVYTGQESWIAHPDKANTFVIRPRTSIYVGVSSHYAGLSVEGIGIKNGIYLSYTANVMVTDLFCSSVDEFKAKLQSLYAAGTPLTVWHNNLVNGAEEKWEPGKTLYTPIILRGGEYRATCLPLTAPLCEGDSVVSWVKSGCDMQVTLDGGVSDGFVYTDVGASGKMRRIKIKIPGVFDYRRGRFGFSDWVKYRAYFNATEESFYCGDTDTVYLFLAAESFAAAKQILSQKPLTMWLRSTNYTEAADIPVSLETHRRAVLVPDGTEKHHIYDRFFYLDGISGPRPQSNTSGICSHYRYTVYGSRAIGVALDGQSIIYSPDGDYVIDEEGFTKWRADLAAQYAAGTPVTIVYQLATPITYAHDPIDFIASPDEEGAWVITGEADGTVSAKYNKNITKAFEDILTRISALELHALGG